MGHTQRRCGAALPAGIQLSDIISLLDEETDAIHATVGHGLSVFDRLMERQEPRRYGNDRSFDTIWNDEFDHRAVSILQLVLLLNRKALRSAGSRRIAGAKEPNVSRLASAYRALCYEGATTLYPSHHVIRGIVEGLVGVFGAAAGGISLQLDMQPLHLNGLKRRCLALLIGDLAISTVRHGMERGAGGLFTIRLAIQTNAQIRVLVETSLCICDSMQGPGYENIRRLAGAMNAELIYRQNARGGTLIEIEIPLDDEAAAAEEVPSSRQDERNRCEHPTSRRG